MTPSTFKRNEEIAAIKEEHANEISDIKKEMKDLKAMLKVVVKQQNPDLDEEDINNMMAHILSKESSTVGIHLSASTHDPYEQVYILKLVLFCTFGGVSDN